MDDNTGNPTSNLDSKKIPHDSTLGRQSAPTLNTREFQKQKTYIKKRHLKNQTHLSTSIQTQSEILKEQFIMDIDALLPPPQPYVIKFYKN